MLLDLVLAMVFLMMVFLYPYLVGAHPDWWRIDAPRGTVLPGSAGKAAYRNSDLISDASLASRFRRVACPTTKSLSWRAKSRSSSST